MATVDEATLGDLSPGAAALHLQGELLSGRAIEARLLAADGADGPKAAAPSLVVFNPAHLVCVAEVTPPRRLRLSGR